MHLALAIRNRGYTNVPLRGSKLRVASRREVRLLRCASRTTQTKAKSRLFNLRRQVKSRVATTSSRLVQDISNVAIANRVIELSSFRRCLRLATPTQIYLQQLV
ncbi:MAG: hypothetical protein HWQ41_14565 [Nostoc sp. NOS(2021)]|uniref:hypothetical protein n=1 Tax=Nostoc sp. NOS(2021) TaxID=2815407 RepID=UPI0025F84DFB|nr:hypothetical protein [Nostoc sp. NOS(2021)]MBN3896436.1 hypothetical protein [Nostoc sp. NOS(2021)]